tara:strand:- start:1510 stop:2685 length:1176 start_codon:yes stop_codon:yes gene_type:complete
MEEKENVVEETTQDTVEETVDKVEEPKKEEKPKTPLNEDGDYKVDLSNPKIKEDAIRENEKQDDEKSSQEKQEKNEEKQEVILEEITDEEPKPVKEEEEVEVEEPVQKEQTPGMELPENVEKLVQFMNETGGTIEDYVKLNKDYSNFDDNNLLREYYQKTKPHLTLEEISFLMEDKFSFDEEIDEARDVKRKKLAYKEAVAEAKQHLEGLKGKYYEDLKLGSKLTKEQQKAINFFNRYNKEQEQANELQQQAKKIFNKQTDKVFNEDFKGFDFKVGDKKYRYNVKDVQGVKEDQSEFVKWLSPYIDRDKNVLINASDYHKTLFAGKNADAIATHFYEQGKADAIKDMTSKAKNINMDARKTDSGVVDTGGIKVRAISGDDSSKLKFKLKNY